MKKFFLCSFFSGPKLYVVYQKNVHIAEFFSKFPHFVLAYVIYEFVHKTFRGVIIDVGGRIFRQYLMADGLQEMGFSESDPAVDEKRVVFASEIFGYRRTRGVGELVCFADDEVFKGIFRMETAGHGAGGFFLGG